MFDWKPICEKITEKVMTYSGFEYNPDVPKWIPKFVRWWGTKFTPAFINFGLFFILLWVFNRGYERYGIEKLFVLFITLYVWKLRTAKKT